MGAELRKTGQNRYEILEGDEVIGEVWNWHGSWSAKAGDETYHGLKSRKQAVKRVERTHRLAK
jgi:cation diffusion facilitator CzcD-associated flavoprotein CzcO